MAERRALSIAARSALAAGLVSAILLVVAGLWFRQSIYDGAIERAIERAGDQRTSLVLAADQGQHVPGLNWRGTFPEVTFEVIHSDGRLLASSADLTPFETNRRPVMVIPNVEVERTGFSRGAEFAARFGPEPEGGPGNHLDENVRRWAGRTVGVVSDRRRVDHYQKGGKWLPEDELDPTIGVYVFVPPFEAEQARADLDRVLWPAMPAGVLLVMLVAYLATRIGLRPVERIRAQTAGMTLQDLHRRVPVPPTRDAVAQLATTLNETLDRLQQSSDQQRRFVADVTHELRSPVASLRAILEVAATHADRADWPEVAGDAIEDLDRIQALIEDLLLLARFDADDLTATEPLDLAGLVARHLAGRPSYDDVVVKAVTVEQAPVDGNARELDRLVRNLVDNAERYARSSVEVSVQSDDGRAVLTVADDGPGIAAADRTRVFERFVRLDDARSRGEGGAGLGLAIAHDIAARHGGRISARRSAAGGALLHVALPLRGED